MPTIYEGSVNTGSTFPSGNNNNQVSTERISANNVITTSTRQFVTQEEKNALTSMLNVITGTAGKVMYKETYDKDIDGKVDNAKIADSANSVLWENIIGKPELTGIEIEQSISESHTHDNKDILDKISYNEVTLNVEYDNTPVINLSNYMIKNTYDADNDGVVDVALYSESTDWNNIINKPLVFTPAVHSHRANELSGEINATYLNGLDSTHYMLKSDSITLDQIEDLNGLNISVKEIDGGVSASTYEDITNKETIIKFRHDIKKYWVANNTLLKKFEIGYEDDTYRHKIGDGFTKWISLPYEYNSVESINFNIKARNFLTKYYSETENQSTASLTNIEFITTGFNELYTDTVRGNNNSFIGIPFNATNVLYANSDLSDIHTFGEELSTINSNGAGWYSGVNYNGIIYCAPYNSDSVLVIDSINEDINIISDYTFDATSIHKYMRGTYCPFNNKIYFAPCKLNKILEIDPETNSLKFYTIPSADEYCDVIYNPLDNNLYFIPMKGSKILQFNTITNIVKVVCELRSEDAITDKFSCALLAPNGLIYCIPSFGYDYIAVFDPNVYTIDYLTFNTYSYDLYRNAIYAPNKCIYLIPSGSSANHNVLEYDVEKESVRVVYQIPSANNKWCGGVLSENGIITCLPFTAGSVLQIDTQLTKNIDYDVLKVFSK